MPQLDVKRRPELCCAATVGSPLNLPSHCKGFRGFSPCARALFGRRAGVLAQAPAGAWQPRHRVGRQIIVFRVSTTLVLAASLLFASLSSAQTSDGQPPPNEVCTSDHRQRAWLLPRISTTPTCCLVSVSANKLRYLLGVPLLFTDQFGLGIMIEVAIEEIHGSD